MVWKKKLPGQINFLDWWRKIFLRFFLSSEERAFLFRGMVKLVKSQIISASFEGTERDPAGTRQMQLKNEKSKISMIPLIQSKFHKFKKKEGKKWKTKKRGIKEIRRMEIPSLKLSGLLYQRFSYVKKIICVIHPMKPMEL